MDLREKLSVKGQPRKRNREAAYPLYIFARLLFIMALKYRIKSIPTIGESLISGFSLDDEAG